MEFIESERGNQKLNIKLKKNCGGQLSQGAIVLLPWIMYYKYRVWCLCCKLSPQVLVFIQNCKRPCNITAFILHGQSTFLLIKTSACAVMVVTSPRFLCRLTVLIKLLVAVSSTRQRNLGLGCDLSQYNYKSNDIAIVWLIEVRIRYVIKHN